MRSAVLSPIPPTSVNALTSGSDTIFVKVSYPADLNAVTTLGENKFYPV